MLNNKPIANDRYKQGLYIPVNKNKVLKLNNKGGLYFRSGLEQKAMIFFDHNPSIIMWGSEVKGIEYTKKTFDKSIRDTITTSHTYYPDFYYEQKLESGEINKVFVEVKPEKDTKEPIFPNNPTPKRLSSFEYELNEYNRNLSKWTKMIEWCHFKGFKFIILTDKLIELYLKGYNK